jgi:hypothetical protein
MTRALIMRALLFLVPFAIYGAYLVLQRYRPGAVVRPTPWTWLFVSGLGLVAASFVIWGFQLPDTAKMVYVPAHVVNGQVVPGHFEKDKLP